MSKAKINVGILGASGYTGADAVRLLAAHPNVEIKLLTGNAHAGKPLAEIIPSLAGFRCLIWKKPRMPIGAILTR